MEKVISALQKVYALIDQYNHSHPEKILRVLTGSVSLAIQWVDIIPSEDIDILTDEEWASKLDELLTQYAVQKSEYSSTDTYRSFFWIYKIDWIQVEVMGDFQYRLQDGSRSPKNQNNKIHYQEYQTMKIPMLYLWQELKEYENMGRIEKAEKIREKLTTEKDQI